jgi:hypothetical protein
VSQTAGAETLAAMLHEELCNDAPRCARWDDTSSAHREHYRYKARAIDRRLEPEIGSVNVFLAVQVILDELL